MVAIQFTNRFFGFQPKVRECGQFLQNLRPELLGVFAAGVEVPCKLVEVAAYLAALGRQGGKRRQCILAALRHHNGVLDVHAVQDAADEFGLGEVEFFAGVCDPQFFFCGHPDFDDVCLSFSRRVIAVLLCVCVPDFSFQPYSTSCENDKCPLRDGEGYVMRHAAFALKPAQRWSRVWGKALPNK